LGVLALCLAQASNSLVRVPRRVVARPVITGGLVSRFQGQAAQQSPRTRRHENPTMHQPLPPNDKKLDHQATQGGFQSRLRGSEPSPVKPSDQAHHRSLSRVVPPKPLGSPPHPFGNLQGLATSPPILSRQFRSAPQDIWSGSPFQPGCGFKFF
jgi:hypothetical protein